MATCERCDVRATGWVQLVGRAVHLCEAHRAEALRPEPLPPGVPVVAGCATCERQAADPWRAFNPIAPHASRNPEHVAHCDCRRCWRD